MGSELAEPGPGHGIPTIARPRRAGRCRHPGVPCVASRPAPRWHVRGSPRPVSGPCSPQGRARARPAASTGPRSREPSRMAAPSAPPGARDPPPAPPPASVGPGRARTFARLPDRRAPPRRAPARDRANLRAWRPPRPTIARTFAHGPPRPAASTGIAAPDRANLRAWRPRASASVPGRGGAVERAGERTATRHPRGRWGQEADVTVGPRTAGATGSSVG